MARGPAHLPIQSADPHGTGCPADTVRKKIKKNNSKKERQAWNNTGSLSGHIKLKRFISCTTYPTGTPPLVSQSRPDLHHSSSSSPPPRHVTMHMHLLRAFNIQYSDIYDLKLTSHTLDHFIKAHAPTTIILHSLQKLHSKTSASNVIPI